MATTRPVSREAGIEKHLQHPLVVVEHVGVEGADALLPRDAASTSSMRVPTPRPCSASAMATATSARSGALGSRK
jgi:hypothetical protein